MKEVRVVNRGIDTLLLNVYYMENERPIRREIDARLASLLKRRRKIWGNLSSHPRCSMRRCCRCSRTEQVKAMALDREWVATF